MERRRDEGLEEGRGEDMEGIILRCEANLEACERAYEGHRLRWRRERSLLVSTNREVDSVLAEVLEVLGRDKVKGERGGEEM